MKCVEERVLRKLCLSLISAPLLLAGGVFFASQEASAQRAAEQQQEQETRRTPAMREAVYQRLSEAQACAEMGDMQCARDKLTQLGRMRDLNSYETAQMYYFEAYLAFEADNYDAAITAYEKVLEQPELPISLEQNTMLSLAQLYAQQERYRDALAMLDRWFMVTESPGTSAYVLKAQIHYQLEEFEQGIPAILAAIDLAREQGRDLEESWFQLLNVFYFELENYPKVIETLTFMVNNWPKKDYFIQLASIYGQEGREDRMTALYEIAYEAGWLTRSQEIVNLAQMLLQSEAPQKAAVILQKGLEDGSVEKTEGNWRLLSQAWQLAREDEKALPALTEAAARSEDGELDVMLANSYANLGRWEECADAARNGLRRGGVERPDTANLLLGNCLAEMKEYDAARTAFQAAARDDRSRSAAQAWLKYLDDEQDRERQLAQAQGRG